jgi:hypothetical protein
VRSCTKGAVSGEFTSPACCAGDGVIAASAVTPWSESLALPRGHDRRRSPRRDRPLHFGMSPGSVSAQIAAFLIGADTDHGCTGDPSSVSENMSTHRVVADTDHRLTMCALGIAASTHDLRHHCASLLIAAGCSVKEVQPSSGTRTRARRWTPTRICGRGRGSNPGGDQRRATGGCARDVHGAGIGRLTGRRLPGSDVVATGRRPVSGFLWAPASRRGVRWPSICAAYPRGAPRRVSRGGRAARPLCVALLRVGFAEPPGSPRTLVRSYRTVSPSPVTGRPVHRRSALCCTDPSGRPDLALASTLPGGVPTFLDTVEPCRGHPAVSPSQQRVYGQPAGGRLSSSSRRRRRRSRRASAA